MSAPAAFRGRRWPSRPGANRMRPASAGFAGWLDRHAPAMFLLPPIALIVVLSIFPLLMSLGLSFVNWNISNPAAGVTFIGLANWLRLFTDAHFRQVLLNTLLYVLIGVPVQYGIGLALAVILSSQIRARNFLRTLFMLPMMLSPVAVSLVVGKILFNQDVGPVNDILARLGMEPVPWLTNDALAFVTVLIVDTWQWAPFMMLLLLAGLQSIPDDVIEAAEIDARSERRAFWHVVFPLLLPWSVAALLIRSIEMLKIVDVVVVLTNGGPGIATEPVTLYAYRTGVQNFDLGYASTIAYALLIVATIGATLFLRALRRSVARAQM
jgi:multiple sugar transport system permease protein